MGKIFVIGIGPGSKDFLTPAAVNAAERADILVGGKTALSLFQGKNKITIGRNLESILEFIKNNRQKNIAVLTSGDPGFFSILGIILKNFPKKDIEVIPGISAMQLCFAKIKESWHDVNFTSVHGRDLENLFKKNENKKLAVLTDGAHTPDKIAQMLLKNGFENRKTIICESLASAKERIVNSDLKKIARKKFSGNCIMVIYPSVPATKEEVRAVALSKAGIKEHSIVYDIGAGAGSISIAAAKIAKRGKIFAVEKDSKRVLLIDSEVKKNGLKNVKVVEGKAPEVLDALPNADRIIIGGSGGEVKGILEKCKKKLKKGGVIVLNAVTLDSLSKAISTLENMNFNFNVTQVSITKSEKVGGSVIMKAQNPVFIIDARAET